MKMMHEVLLRPFSMFEVTSLWEARECKWLEIAYKPPLITPAMRKVDTVEFATVAGAG